MGAFWGRLLRVQIFLVSLALGHKFLGLNNIKYLCCKNVIGIFVIGKAVTFKLQLLSRLERTIGERPDGMMSITLYVNGL